MKIAILLASYNGEQYIRQQIDSIISQTFREWILYINDDGSTDATTDIISGYAARFPNQIQQSYNSSGRHGAKNNFADLFQKVPQADWYVFCDQDDIWPDNRLEKLVYAAQTSKIHADQEVPAIIYGKAEIVDNDLNPSGKSIEECMHIQLEKKNYRKQVLLWGYIWGCTMMYNHALRELTKIIPQEIAAHDNYLVLVCAYFGKIIKIEDTVVKYRQHGNNVSFGVSPLYIDILRRLKHLKGMLNRIRTVREETKLQIKIFLDSYYGKLSRDNQEQILSCIEILEYKSRIHSLLSAVRNQYWGWKDYHKYTILLFVVKGNLKKK